jgi:serine/threonine-protein kinase
MADEQSPPRRFRPGQKVAGKYVLRGRLAIGGMAEVWIARNASTGAQVALKLLRRGGSDARLEEEVAARFRNEARVSAGLAHRNVVKVYDLVEEPDGTLGLVMELLRGETLHASLYRVGSRPPDYAVAVMSAVLSALAHAHDRGYVHRDVTPANIFLAVDPDGHITPKLVDFGIAKLKSSLAGEDPAAVVTLDGRVLGTPMYMAPERIRGSDAIDPRSDIFSAAVILYEMITGVSPFAASTPAASLAAVLERVIDPDPRIEPRLWLEIRRAMAKQLYERHATAQEFAEAIRAAIDGRQAELRASLLPGPLTHAEGEEAAEHPSGSAPHSQDLVTTQLRPVPSRRRARVLTWLAAVFVAALALGGALLFSRGSKTADARGAGSAAAPAPSGAGVPPSGAALPAETPPTSSTAVATAIASARPAAPSAPSTDLSAGAGAAAEGAAATGPSSHPRRPPAPEVSRPKPIATTPGF